MINKVEEVARALCRSKRNAPPEQYPPGWIDRHVNENWHLFVDDARTAMKAMRSPTAAMVYAGSAAVEDLSFCDTGFAYACMIDEALK